MRKYLVAIIQMDSINSKEVNMTKACEFIDEAVAKGAKLIAFPENVDFMGDIVDGTVVPEVIPGYATQIFMSKAKEHNVFINCGSIKEVTEDGDRQYNTSVMINNKGEVIAKYRKLHLFDVNIDGREILESARNKPGKEIVNVETELGNFGLTICYDIRFPELYRLLTLNGAQVIFTPANFATTTGKDHWETILKTRAIESGCYIVAAAQYGKKLSAKGTFNSFGSSLVIDPWGTVIARASERPGVTMAEIDLDYLDRVREMLPGLKNRRADVYDISIK